MKHARLRENGNKLNSLQQANAKAHELADPAKLQQSKDEVNKMFADCDTNQDGLHDVTEHIAFA